MSPDRLPVPSSSQLDVVLAGLSCFLSERMKHIDRLGELGNVEYTEGIADIDTNLVYPRVHIWHWLSVEWIIAALDKMEIVPRLVHCFGWELTQILQRGADPTDGFLSMHDQLYEILYIYRNRYRDGVCSLS